MALGTLSASSTVAPTLGASSAVVGALIKAAAPYNFGTYSSLVQGDGSLEPLFAFLFIFLQSSPPFNPSTLVQFRTLFSSTKSRNFSAAGDR